MLCLSLGRKLLHKFDGPFEIMEKLSPVTYRLRLPSSYQIHPVINIAHLERYNKSPEEFGPRLTRQANRQAKAAQEWEVDCIVDEKQRKRGKKHYPMYKIRYSGYGPEHDQWVSTSWLRNAPEILRDWIKSKKGNR